MNKCELYWLAGILEGEGSFLRGTEKRPSLIKISIQMTDEDIIKRVAELFGRNYWISSDKRRLKNPHWKTVYGTTVNGLKALELMEKLRPLMGIRRRSKIDEAIACFEQNAKTGRYMTEDIVASILQDEQLGKLTQKQIGDKYGLRRETINKICRGKLPKWAYLTTKS